MPPGPLRYGGRWPASSAPPLLISDPGPGRDIREAPDAVGVVAQIRQGKGTWVCWQGDCRAYGWDPDAGTLTRYTTDHNATSYLLQYGVEPEIAERYSSRLHIALADATPATVHQTLVPAGHLVILTSDGVHDQVDPLVMEVLVRENQHTPQNLAEALVAAAQPDEKGYRDDATALVLAPARPDPGVLR
ncbi:PP2C family protein-serine/threonine phosphatase [Streptomyces sp. NPDC051555]|uniref:PP2C family protein-serine/threonine phosphatase n=1 Tax=Streptomyces sp. NPDC051555 TaxID=3365657 RepID=UPI0037911BA0